MKKYLTLLNCLAGILFVSCSHKQTQIEPDAPQSHYFPYTIEQLEKRLKTPGFNINARYLLNDRDVETLLYMAAEQNDLDMVKFLVAHGASIERCDFFDSYHPLGATTDPRIVEFFLQNGVDIETSSGMSCVTRLHQDVAKGDPEMVELCFKYGANPNPHLGNGDCRTPLLEACWCLKNPKKDQKWWGPERKHERQYFEVIKILVKNGADIRAVSKYMETALDIAKDAGNKEVIKFLQRELRKKRPYPYTLKELKKKVADPQFDINAEYGSRWDRFGRTLLALAAYNDDFQYVEFLISHGAKCNDNAPLEAAAIHGNARIMKLLLGVCHNLEERCDFVKQRDSFVMSPLATACLYCKGGDRQHLETIKLLVKSGANLNWEDSFGRTPLSLLVLCHLEAKKDDPYTFVWKGNIDAVEFLLKHGAKVGIEALLLFKEKSFEYGDVLNIVRSSSLDSPEEIKLRDLLEEYLKING
ncbi:MAG: ankyrin repeat domain-containing protein [Holosporales bacterium]|nr:ankyrin repeat domain-containing protein [Holosporales bacterium]